MSYLLASDLLTRIGAEELLQVCDRTMPRLVTAELLAAAVASADLSSWPADEVAAVATVMSRLATAIKDAQSEIDSYLASRYSVPLATPPAVVARFAGDIARYCLHGNNADDTVQKRYDTAIAFLKNVAAGKATLGPEAQTPAPVGGIVEIVSAGKIFGRQARGL